MSATSTNSLRYKCKHTGLSAHDLDSRCSRARAMNMFENRKLQSTIYKLSKKHLKRVEKLQRETFELKYILKQMPPAPPPSMQSEVDPSIEVFASRASTSAGAVLTTTVAVKPGKNHPAILTPHSAPTSSVPTPRRKGAIVPGTPNALRPSPERELAAQDRHSAIQMNIEHLRRVAAKAAEQRAGMSSDDSASETDPDMEAPTDAHRATKPRSLAQRRLSFLQKLDEARKRRRQNFLQSAGDGNGDHHGSAENQKTDGEAKSFFATANKVRRMSLLLPPTHTYDFASKRRLSLQMPDEPEDSEEKLNMKQNGNKKTVRIKQTTESIEYEADNSGSLNASLNLSEWSVAGRRQDSLGFSSYGLDDDDILGDGKKQKRSRRFSVASSGFDSDNECGETMGKGRRSEGSNRQRRNSLSQASMARRMSLQRANKPTTYHLEKRLRSMQRRLSTAQPATYAELSKVSQQLDEKPNEEPEIKWPRKEREKAALMLENEVEEQAMLKVKVNAFLERAKQVPKPHARLRMTKSEHDMRQFQQAMRQLEIR